MSEIRLHTRLLAFLYGPASNVFKQYFETYVLIPRFRSKLENFLNDVNNKHVLFHQFHPNWLCCQCQNMNMQNQKARGCLDKKTFDVLFDDTGAEPHEQKKGNGKRPCTCICKFSAKAPLDVDQLDIPLLYNIMRTCCQSVMNSTSFSTIKTIRNQIVHHGKCELERVEFEKLWVILTEASLEIAKEIGLISVKMFKREIDELHDSSVAKLKDMMKESFLNLAKSIREDSKSVLESVNRLGSMIVQTDKDDSTSFKMVKMEITDEGKNEEIFFNVENLKCLLKLSGMPNDLQQTEVEEKSPDVKGNQLVNIEWTMECPKKWNMTSIASTINDKLAAFHDEINVDYVYTETSSKLVIYTTTHRHIFRSLSSIEVVVKKFIDNIMNVCSLKSTEPEELSVSAIVMSIEEEFPEANFNKDVKTDQSIFGLKDNIVTCEHCTKNFDCKNCTSKINHIRRLDHALKMKNQTIQRLERALTEREEEMIEEPERKKRKTAVTSVLEMAEGEKLIAQDGQLMIDRKQALLKLGEIPLVEHKIQNFKTCMEKTVKKWFRMKTSARAIHKLKPKQWAEKLKGLRQEKKLRTDLIATLSDIIHREEQIPISEETYVTDLGFLNVNVDTTITCNNCHIVEENKVSCYCVNCKIFLCDICGKEHQLAKKVHKYLFRSGHLRGYEQTHVINLSDDRIIDIKCLNANCIVMLKSKHGHKECILATYEFTGVLRNEYIISTKDSKSRIACLNDSTVAITVPMSRYIYISGVKPTINKTEIQTPTEHTMTGGIACRTDVLYVAFSDAIRVMNLLGQIQFKINLPSVNILHLVNNNKMLCVYSEENTEKAVSCLDLSNNDNVSDFVNFPFHPNDITSDDDGNIVFSADGLIWQADSDGNNSQVIISTPGYLYRYKTLCYERESKTLVTCAFYNDRVHLYKKLQSDL